MRACESDHVAPVGSVRNRTRWGAAAATGVTDFQPGCIRLGRRDGDRCPAAGGSARPV